MWHDDAGKATCFAYGQTGSGKTYTMQPLPIRAAAEILSMLAQPQFADLNLFVSCFEIYGGKLYDLLNARNRLDMREDSKKVRASSSKQGLTACKIDPFQLQHAYDI